MKHFPFHSYFRLNNEKGRFILKNELKKKFIKLVKNYNNKKKRKRDENEKRAFPNMYELNQKRILRYTIASVVKEA